MKKTAMIVAVAAITLAGCTKEQDLSNYLTREQVQEMIDQIPAPEPQPAPEYDACTVYQFNVTFPAVSEQYSSDVTYSGLVGKMDKDDALLLYIHLGDSWAALPYCQGNDSFVYYRYNDGKIKISWGRALNITFTQEAVTASMKAYVIPHTLVSNLKSKGVDLSTPDKVEAALAAENAVMEIQ